MGIKNVRFFCPLPGCGFQTIYAGRCLTHGALKVVEWDELSAEAKEYIRSVNPLFSAPEKPEAGPDPKEKGKRRRNSRRL